MKTGFLMLVGVLSVAGLIAGCGSSPVTLVTDTPAVVTPEAPAAAVPAGKTDHSSSWLVGKWLSLSTGLVNELTLLQDGTGTLNTFEGSGNKGTTMKLAFDPAVNFFTAEPAAGIAPQFNYTGNEARTQLTVDLPDTKGSVFLREDALITEVCAGDNIVAILRLGNYYSVNGDAKCIVLFTEAVNRGDRNGNLNLGNYYYKRDKAKAFEYYLKAAEQGEPQAEFNVFVFYYNGEGGVAQDLDKAIDWLIKAAEHGSPDAINVVNQLTGGQS
jgi:TPR repeat protein